MDEKIKQFDGKFRHYDRMKFEDITPQCEVKFGLTGIAIWHGNKRIIQSRRIEGGEQSAERSAQMFYVVPEFRPLVCIHHYPSSFMILWKK